MLIREAVAKQIADSQDGGAGIIIAFVTLVVCGAVVSLAAIAARVIESGCL